jgi:internalin A
MMSDQRLDLQRFPRLRYLTASIGDLSALRGLDHLVQLDVHGERQPLDLSAIEGLTNLESLDLYRCVIHDYSTLRNLRRLRTLGTPVQSEQQLTMIVESCPYLQSFQGDPFEGIGDLAPLGRLTDLREINVSRDPVQDLAFLGGLQKLEDLNLWVGSAVSDLSPLRGLTEMANLELSVDNCNDVSFSFLKGLANLQTLRLSGAPDWEPVGAPLLPKLACLSCTGEALDLRPLARLPSLVSVEVDCREVTHLWDPPPDSVLACLRIDAAILPDLRPLAALKHLKELDLKGCRQVSDPAPLGEIPNLRFLRLESCYGLTDLSFLENARRLRTLHFELEMDEETHVDWTPLGKLRQLEYLRIDGGYQPRPLGAVLEAVANLTGLIGLSLAGYEDMTDLEPFTEFSRLKYLDLSGCQSIRDYSPLGRMPNLRRLSLHGSNVKDLSFLDQLPNLRFLSIDGCVNLELADLGPIRDYVRRGGFVAECSSEYIAEILQAALRE